jgi:hypothetical protein
MSRVEIRDLGEPEAVVSYPLGTSSQVRLAETVVTRHLLQPGWTWEEHARPLVGTATCELYHRGIVLSGRMGVRTDGGEQLVIGPNQVFDLPPGHVTWVEGDEELVMVDWAGGAGFDTQPGEEARVPATILFTDIVDSTARASDAGDASFQYEGSFDRNRVIGVADKARAAFEGMPGLRLKFFTLDESARRANNFYVWDSKDAALDFFSDELRERVTELYGVAPTIEFVQIAQFVDNSRS